MKIKHLLPLLNQVLGFLVQKGKFNTAFATTTVASSVVYSDELIAFVKNTSELFFDTVTSQMIAQSLTTGGVATIVAGVFATINLFMNLKKKQ